ncbi:MAG TPA: hypothetical protein VEB66_11700 [Opitutaceae bacterium]|nr:hypothetical protein [Opitutaceae bacterium]
MTKKTLTALLVSCGLAASASAIVTSFEAGYLIDSEAEYLTARIGLPVASSETRSHLFELELGHTDFTDSGVKSRLTPLTLNYRLETAGQGPWGFYAGAGVGAARTRVQIGGLGFSRSDNAFAAQGFAGVSYQAGPSTKLTLGAKYLWIHEIDIFGTSIEVGDDVAVSLGVSFRF